MSDYYSTSHIPVWGIVYGASTFCVVGTISVDRTTSTPTYMAQHDDSQAVFDDDVSAAEWLAAQDRRHFDHVLLGRVFRPFLCGEGPLAHKSGRALAGRH